MGDDEQLNKKFNFAVFPENQGGPLMHVIAAKAVCFKEAMSAEFVEYQRHVLKNARAMVEVFLARGFEIVSGGTDDHLFLLSLVGREITGKQADEALGRANITVNKNAVPNDPRPPFIRIRHVLFFPTICGVNSISIHVHFKCFFQAIMNRF